MSKIDWKGEKILNEVRNSDGRLICKADPERQEIEIVMKDIITMIKFRKDAQLEIENRKKTY
jgi:hypothetical protein